MVEQSILDSIQRYFSDLRKSGINPSFGVLFGSQITGKTHEYSDIDLIVVARRFDETKAYKPRALLWRVAARSDSRIEPIPCGVKQWEVDDGTPILEVARREGIRVEVSKSTKLKSNLLDSRIVSERVQCPPK